MDASPSRFPMTLSLAPPGADDARRETSAPGDMLARARERRAV